MTKDNTSYAITSAHAIPAGLFDECPIDSVLLPALTDSIGTRAFAIPAQPESHIKTAEMSTEQNYNMIDGMMKLERFGSSTTLAKIRA